MMDPDYHSTFLSARDRRTLARCEQKRADKKWHAIQAGFFNAAGRMVDTTILKHKFGEDNGIAPGRMRVDTSI